jgi:DNA-binding response OmpR family regulator
MLRRPQQRTAAGEGRPVKILLAEDDLDLSDVTAFALRRQGCTVHVAYSGAQALQYFHAERPDVVILDICLPEPDGIDVLREIRAREETPVIMLTGRTDEPAMFEAFGAGADDYVTKPFSFRQLFLRVQAVTRRAANQRPSSELDVGGVIINPDTWTVTYQDAPVGLTRLEFRILHCLASHFNRVTPTGRLLSFVWQDDGGDTNVLKTHISHVRQKLSGVGARLIITAVPNVGYMLKAPIDDATPVRLGAAVRSNVS